MPPMPAPTTASESFFFIPASPSTRHSGRREAANPESRATPGALRRSGFRARAYGAPRNDRELLARNAGFVDHRVPFLDVGDQPRHQLLRRARMRVHAELVEALLDLGHGQYFAHRLVHLLQNFLRHA